MKKPMLQINDLTVAVEDRELLHHVNLEIKRGETHVLMGPNGAGKSTLGNVLMGNPKYQVKGGTIHFLGKDITEESADKRAQDGIFLSFQEPLEVPGLALDSFLNNAVRKRRGNQVRIWNFMKEVDAAMKILQMDASYKNRGLNVGFSGGEKRFYR